MALNIGSVGEELNLTVKQGSTFGPLEFHLKDGSGAPVDLTGVVFKAQIRKTATSTALTKEMRFETVDASDGRMKMWLTAADTRSIKAVDDPKSPDNVYVWDMEMTDSLGVVRPLYWGKVTMFREVTRG